MRVLFNTFVFILVFISGFKAYSLDLSHIQLCEVPIATFRPPERMFYENRNPWKAQADKRDVRVAHAYFNRHKPRNPDLLCKERCGPQYDNSFYVGADDSGVRRLNLVCSTNRAPRYKMKQKKVPMTGGAK